MCAENTCRIVAEMIYECCKFVS